MKITWLGHSGFRIATGNQILLVDPWLTGNPVLPEARRAEAIAGAAFVSGSIKAVPDQVRIQ